jgi:hypothetical protein
MRRTISFAVAGVLAVVVVATIIVTASGGGSGGSRKLVTVRGVIGSEKKPFFDDKRVKTAFEKAGLDVHVDTAGSRQIATSVDLSRYDFAFPAGTPAAEKIRQDRKVTTTYVPFFTPMAVASFRDIANLLQAAGVAKDQGGWWSLDMGAFVRLVDRGTRWTDLPNNTAYPAVKQVLITSTDIATSNSAAMYASIASYAANGNTVLGNPGQVDRVLGAVTPLFSRQGFTERSSEAPFDDYLSIGAGKTPLVMIYEAQFLARAAARDGSITNNMVLMYPTPDVLSKHTVVPLTANGDRVGGMLAADTRLQQLAVEYGFRTNRPGDFNAFVRRTGITTPPTLVDLIEPPTYDTLETLITRIDASLRATTTAPPASTGG